MSTDAPDREPLTNAEWNALVAGMDLDLDDTALGLVMLGLAPAVERILAARTAAADARVAEAREQGRAEVVATVETALRVGGEEIIITAGYSTYPMVAVELVRTALHDAQIRAMARRSQFVIDTILGGIGESERLLRLSARADREADS